MTLEQTLAERGNRYGKFEDHAKIAMALKDVMRKIPPYKTIRQAEVEGLGTVDVSGPAWNNLAPDQQQSLDTICDKIARILNGDPNYIDNWHDIQGYAKLVEDRLQAEQSLAP